MDGTENPFCGRGERQRRADRFGTRRALEHRFAEQLNAEVERAGISQAELARRCELTPGFVSRLRSGERNPGPVVVEAIVAALALDARAADELRIAAGLAPLDDLAGIADEPEVVRLVRILRSDQTSPVRRAALRKTIAQVAALAHVAFVMFWVVTIGGSVLC